MKGYRLTPMERSCYRIYWRKRKKRAAIFVGVDGTADFSAHFSNMVFESPVIDRNWCARKRRIEAAKKWGFIPNRRNFGRVKNQNCGGFGVIPIRERSIKELREAYAFVEDAPIQIKNVGIGVSNE